MSIINVINNVAQSATAIAKAAGYSKAIQIQEELDKLVAEGKVIKDETGRFPTYTKAKAKKVVKATEEVTVVSAAKAAQAPISADDNLNHIGGYSLKPAKNKAGQKGKKVTFPNGKVAFIPEGSSLLIINDEHNYIVNTPANVFQNIGTWTKNQGWATFSVTQLDVGNIAKPGDLKMIPVLIIKITKVNKAAM